MNIETHVAITRKRDGAETVSNVRYASYITNQKVKDIIELIERGGGRAEFKHYVVQVVRYTWT